MRLSLILFVLSVALSYNTAHAASATVTPVYPAETIAVGVPVNFYVLPSGFTNPAYYVVDSFAGGITTNNINSSGSLSWTPNKDEIGTHTLTITVSDTENSIDVTQTLVVEGPASLTAQSPSPGENITIGTPLSFSLSPYGLFNPTFEVIDSFPGSSLTNYALNSSGSFNWTPILQDIGTHTITLKAKDVYDNQASVSKTIVVLPTPTVSFIKVTPGTTVGTGSLFSFTATSTGFIDPTYTAVRTFNGISSTTEIDAAGKTTWTPQKDDVGVHHFDVTVSDSDGRSKTASLSVTVQQSTGPPPTTQVSTTSITSTQTQSGSQSSSGSSAATTQSTSKNSSTPAKTQQTTAGQENTLQTVETTLVSPASQASSSYTLTVKDVDLPPLPPDESFGQFIVHSIVNFFSSLFSLF